MKLHKYTTDVQRESNGQIHYTMSSEELPHTSLAFVKREFQLKKLFNLVDRLTNVAFHVEQHVSRDSDHIIVSDQPVWTTCLLGGDERDASDGAGGSVHVSCDTYDVFSRNHITTITSHTTRAVAGYEPRSIVYCNPAMQKRLS